jgi:hypothetical protein
MNILIKRTKVFNGHEITEGIEGMWHYHISDRNITISLCGKQTMRTNIPFESWGSTGHLKERYCQKCYDRFKKSLTSGPGQ